MLENETIQGVLGSKPSGLRKRSTSFPEEAVTLEVLLQRLSYLHTTMSQHGVDLELIKQVVKQQFYIICAVTLNHLLLRKDMCSWSKGLQIRYHSTVAFVVPLLNKMGYERIETFFSFFTRPLVLLTCKCLLRYQ